MKSPYSGIKRILFAFKNSFNGLKVAFKSEAAFRQDLFLVLILSVIIYFLKISDVRKALLVFSLIFVLFAELTNSAIEAVVDRISPDYHKLSGIAKDMGSAIVFLSFVNLIFIWFFILKNII